MKSSEKLRRAKKLLWDGVSPCARGLEGHICLALDKAVGWKKSSGLRLVIMSRLRPYEGVRTWLREVVGVPWDQLTDENVQAYRHRWLDHLINEYQSKGD